MWRKQQCKYIIEAGMVYTPEMFANNSPRYTMTPTPVNKPSAIKSLCIFTKILDVENRTDVCWVGAAKSKRKAIVIIDRGVSAPVHGKELVGFLNAIYKLYIYIN